MNKNVIIFVFFFLSLCQSAKILTQTNGPDPINYNSYALTLLVTNDYCHINLSLECRVKVRWLPMNHLLVYGLLPAFNGNSINPVEHEDYEVVYNDGSDIFRWCQKNWVSLTGQDVTFWTRIYNDYGYWYTTKYQKEDFRDYFGKTQEVVEQHKLNNLIIEALGEQRGEVHYSQAQLLEKFNAFLGGNYTILTCDTYLDRYYLTKVDVVFDLDFNLVPQTREGNCPRIYPIYIIYDY